VDRTVVFVCQHGAGKSRVAAAWFATMAPPGWRAASAGLTPQATVSPHAAGMIGDAAEHLDTTRPKALTDVAGELLVGIDCVLPAARHWRLAAEWPDPATASELRLLATALADELRQDAPHG
jgi:protein-tyrosine-phosphatase